MRRQQQQQQQQSGLRTPAPDTHTSNKGSKQPPSTTHVSIAALTLPPGVPGDVKGELVACVEALHWKYRQPPAQVQLRIVWWGAPAGTDAVVPFHASRGAGAAFAVTSGPRFLVRYLRDMGSLSVGIEECPSGRNIGTVLLDTSRIDVTRPLQASLPCLGTNKQLLATADVSLRIRYSALLSSFEMAEHLASADKGLPLYPLPPAAQRQHAAAAADAAEGGVAGTPGTAAGAGAAAAVATAAPGAATAAPAGPGTGSTQPASNPQKQQQQQQPDPASGVTQPGNTMQVAAAAPEATGTPAKAAAAAGQHQPPADAISEVIRKAEQLKASLDQAAKAGVMLALPRIQQQQQQLTVQQLLQGHGSSPSRLPALLPGPGSSSSSRPLPADVLGLQGWAAAGGAGLLLGLQAAAAAGPPLLLGPAGSSRRRKHRARGSGGSSSRDGERSSSGASSFEGRAVGSSRRHHRRSSSGGGSSHDSSLLAELDGLEELEDLLLQELLNLRTPAAAAAAATPARHKPHCSSSCKPAHRQGAHVKDTSPGKFGGQQEELEAGGQAVQAGAQVSGVSEDASQQQQQQQQSANAAAAAAGPQLHVELLSLCDLPAAVTAVTAVLKCAGQQQAWDATALVHHHHHQQQQQAGAPGAGASPVVSTTLAGPLSLLQPLLPAQRPCLVVELWTGQPTTPLQTAHSPAASPQQLLGIVWVPLQQQQQQEQEPGSHWSSSSDTQQLVEGSFPVYDVLQGKAVGTLELSVHLLLLPAAAAGTGVAGAGGAADRAVQQLPAGPSAAAAEGAAGGAGDRAGVVGVRHVIDVTLVSASGLPDVGQLARGQQPVPDKRFVKYSFPGDEPLYTQEVDCVAAPAIAAHARHTLLLQPGESIADCFVGEAGSPEQLLFEVFDKWPDDSDSLAAAGALPLQQVLDLCQDHPAAAKSSSSSSGSSGEGKEEAGASDPRSSSTFLVHLSLDPSSPEAVAVLQQSVSQQSVTAAAPAATVSQQSVPLQSQQSVLLQVAVSYSVSPCFDVQEPPEPLPPAVPAAAAAAADVGQQQEAPLLQQGAQQDEQAQAGAPVQQQQQQQEEGVTGVGSSAGQHAADVPQSPAAAAEAGCSSQQYPLVLHDQQNEQPAAAAAGQLRQSPQVSPSRAGAHAGEGQAPTAAAAAAAGPGAADAAVPLTAELCVKVVRACGLQAAVKEAEGWLGNASGLLGRARQLGPHPFVTLVLFPASSSVPALRTPFQAQTFCPQFHYQQVLPIRLDAPTLTALATGEGSLELWHHCPRSQAVAAALSRGLSSSYAMTGQQQVFLGSASLPLQGLLIHPQGIRCWVVCRSELGAPVGAVQLEVWLSHIGGTPCDSSPAAPPPLIRHPEWLQLLPAAPARRLSGCAASPPPGFAGQWVRLSLHVEELLLPGGDEAALERPRIASYLATYRLPGSASEGSTQAKACSSQSASTNLLGRSWHVDWRCVNHAWARGDGVLARAILAYPLTLTLHRQEPDNQQQQQQQRGGQQQGLGQGLGLVVQGKGAGGPTATAAAAAVVPVGSVDVDLSGLLATRPGSSAPSCRWLSGVYPVIHPLSKALGNTRLRLKVLLDLQPQEQQPTDTWLATHPASHWQVSGPLAALGLDLQAAAAAAEPPAGAARDAAAAGRGEFVTGVGPAEAAGAAEEQQQQQQQGQQGGSSPAAGIVGAAATQSGAASSSGGDESSAPAETASRQQQEQQQGLVVAAGVISAPPPTAAAGAGSAEPGGGSSSSRAGGLRLRAEVSRVSAPPGVLSPGSAAVAGGAAAAAYSVCGSPTPAQQQQQQQQQLMLLPAVQGSPIQQQQQQLAQQAVLVAQAGGRHVALCDVRVCVECALNLDLPELGPGWLPALYVRYAWPGVCGVVTTPLVEASRGPLGSVRCQSVRWYHCVHLPLAMKQQQQQQPTDKQQQQQQTVSASSSASSGDVAGGPALNVLFQVWCRPLPKAAAAELPPLYAGLVAVPTGSDGLLGCADLDLGALTLLGALDGWYNIRDIRGQDRGQIKVSLSPLRPLEGPPQPLTQPTDSLQQVLAAWPAGGTTQPLPAAPVADITLESSLAQLQQQVERMQQQQQQEGELVLQGSSAITTPMLQGSLESSLAQLQEHLQQLQRHADTLHDASSGAGQQQQQHPGGAASLLPDDYADLLTDDLPLAEDSSAATVEQLSDAAFMALAAHSTAAAEEAAAAVEAVTNVGQLSMAQPDALLDTLRANLQELDKLSAALAVRIGRSPAGIDSPKGGPQSVAGAGIMAPPGTTAATSTSSDQATQPTAAAAAANPVSAVNSSFRHVRTLSDDEEYLVAGAAGVSDSSADTDELMGRVDWSLAANSDDEHDVPPGPPPQQQQVPSSTAAGSVLQRPLNTEDWMFDIGRSTNRVAAAAAAAAAAGGSTSGSSSLQGGSSSQVGLMHPGQMSAADAPAAAAAAAARLGAVEEARAAAAATRRASMRDEIAAAAASGSGGAAAAAAGGPAADMWDELGKAEAEDAAAAAARSRQRRQQRDRQLAAVLDHLPRTAGQQQQQQAGLQHDPRPLPDALESRLDALLAEFQVQASGPGAFVARGATGPLPQFGSYSAQAPAAAAFGRLEGGGAWGASEDDFDAAAVGSDDSGDFLPVTRVTHVSREPEPGVLQQQQQAGAAEQGDGDADAGTALTTAAAGGSSSRGTGGRRDRDADEGETLPRVVFANALPPVQEDFALEYSDGPPRAWMEANRQPRRVLQQQQPQQQQTQQQPQRQQQHPQQGGSSSAGMQQMPGHDSAAAASRAVTPPVPTAPAAQQQQQPLRGEAVAAAAGPAPQAEASSSSGFRISTVGRRPVSGGGGGSGPVDIMDEMFSISRRPSSSNRSSSSGQEAGGAGSSIRHPGM